MHHPVDERRGAYEVSVLSQGKGSAKAPQSLPLERWMEFPKGERREATACAAVNHFDKVNREAACAEGCGIIAGVHTIESCLGTPQGHSRALPLGAYRCCPTRDARDRLAHCGRARDHQSIAEQRSCCRAGPQQLQWRPSPTVQSEAPRSTLVQLKEGSPES